MKSREMFDQFRRLLDTHVVREKPGGGNRVEKSEGFPEGPAYHS